MGCFEIYLLPKQAITKDIFHISKNIFNICTKSKKKNQKTKKIFLLWIDELSLIHASSNNTGDGEIMLSKVLYTTFIFLEL